MLEKRKRSISLQKNQCSLIDCYFRSEYSPEKLKRKSQKSQQTIILTSPYPKNQLQLEEVPRHFGIDVISVDYFLKRVESENLLLFETNNTGAKLQRIFTKTKYDHVAIAIKMANKYSFIFDANADSGVTFQNGRNLQKLITYMKN